MPHNVLRVLSVSEVELPILKELGQMDWQAKGVRVDKHPSRYSEICFFLSVRNSAPASQ